VAESYMDGDWESPDVTSFLELFVVNSAIGERIAGGASWTRQPMFFFSCSRFIVKPGAV